MTESERRQIIELIKKEVIPAIGCMEPIAVALFVAKAAERVVAKPEKIDVLLSANTVSYTHLDVYKRQHRHTYPNLCSMKICQLKFCIC